MQHKEKSAHRRPIDEASASAASQQLHQALDSLSLEEARAGDANAFFSRVLDPSDHFLVFRAPPFMLLFGPLHGINEIFFKLSRRPHSTTPHHEESDVSW